MITAIIALVIVRLYAVETDPSTAVHRAHYDVIVAVPTFNLAQRPIVVSYNDELVRRLRFILHADFSVIRSGDAPTPANQPIRSPKCLTRESAGVVKLGDEYFQALSPRPPEALEQAVITLQLYDCAGNLKINIRETHDFTAVRSEDPESMLKEALQANMERALGAFVLKLGGSI
jgi:hypothetical protein